MMRFLIAAAVSAWFVSVSFAEKPAGSYNPEKRIKELNALISSQKKEIGRLSGNISDLSRALAELNKKNYSFENSVREIEERQKRIIEDNLAIKSSLKLNSEGASNTELLLQKQNESIDSLNRQVKLLGKSLFSLQEKQSVGEHALKKEYTETTEKRRKTSRFLNMASIVMALVALGTAL